MILTHKETYCTSTMFVTHGNPSFFELLQNVFSQRNIMSSNSITMAPAVFTTPFTPQKMVEISIILNNCDVLHVYTIIMYVLL